MNTKRIKSLVISSILLIFTASFVAGTVRVTKKGKRLIDAKKELEALQKQKTDLDKELEYRKSAEFIEQEARNKLNMVKEGEEVYLKPKILGDDLLGSHQGPRNELDNPEKPGGLFAPITSKILYWFDNMKDFLLLFQS